MQELNKLEKIISLAKRRGFIYPGSEIYGGLAGSLGLRSAWRGAKKITLKILGGIILFLERSDMYGVDAAILMNSKSLGGFRPCGRVRRPADGMQELPQEISGRPYRPDCRRAKCLETARKLPQLREKGSLDAGQAVQYDVSDFHRFGGRHGRSNLS